MERSQRFGGAVFGAAMVGFGLLNLVRLDMLPGIEPLPAWMPARAVWACLSGAVLVAAGGSLVAGQRVRTAATVLAGFLACWAVLLHLPRLLMDLRNGGIWVVFCEVVALCAVAAVLAAGPSPDAAWSRVAVWARAAFGATFLLFGLSHFLYRAYVESVIPGWIPAHGFWAVATGLAHVAAGVSLLTRVWSRLAATLLAIMFGTWVAIVHLPRVAAAPRAADEWSSLFVALAMCGGSWLVAASLAVPDGAPAAARRDARTKPSALAST